VRGSSGVMRVNQIEKVPLRFETEIFNRIAENIGRVKNLEEVSDLESVSELPTEIQKISIQTQSVRKDSIKLVVLNFSSYHFMRNTLSRKYRSHLKIGYNRSSDKVQQQMAEANFPFLSTCGDAIQYVSWNEIYDNWRGREWLATVNAFQTAYDKISDDEANQIKVTACIMQEMAKICEENGIRFQIACLNRSAQSEQLKEQVKELSWMDVGFSFQDTTLTNYPIDDHPSPFGHQFIAKQLEQHLGSLFQSLKTY